MAAKISPIDINNSLRHEDEGQSEVQVVQRLGCKPSKLKTRVRLTAWILFFPRLEFPHVYVTIYSYPCFRFVVFNSEFVVRGQQCDIIDTSAKH